MKISAEYFDKVTERRHTNSLKWDEYPDTLPLWVADMDFRTAPPIIEALVKRAQHGIFGYTHVPDEYYDAYINWFSSRHGWNFNREDIIYTIGIVPAISAILKAMTSPGDKVIVQSPTYNCFFSSIRNNGCRLLANHLIDTGNGYVIDFEDLEAKASDPEAKVLILCNPHNPVGRIWTRDELKRIADICLKHNIFVISDEIHCEFTYNGAQYTPFATLGDDVVNNCAVCVSPSKAFNIAGLQISNIVVRNESIRNRIDRAINDNEVCDVNPFGVIAAIKAYTEGAPWLDGLMDYLYDNYCYLREFFRQNFPQFPVTPLEATYLAWVNVSSSGMSGKDFCKMVCEKTGLKLNDGEMYGPGGEDYIRINFACPRSILEDAMQRLRKALS